MRVRDLNVPDLASPEFTQALCRAEKRIEEALLVGKISEHSLMYNQIEILSFPIAVVMTSALNDTFLKRRYATAEAKKASALLQKEGEKEKIIKVALNFNWKIRAVKTGGFAVHFSDFLRNSTASFREKEWKLINRRMDKGEVYLTQEAVARLLEEEVRRYVEKKLEPEIEFELPQSIAESIERLKQLLETRKVKFRKEEMPKEVVTNAFPPCIHQLHKDALSGRHLSHMGRFTLACFLVHAGMSVDDVVNSFRNIADFNERLTRYQVEHIAGERGSKERYILPSCDTLRTHGICQDMNRSCNVRTPTSYYKREIYEAKTRGETQ